MTDRQLETDPADSVGTAPFRSWLALGVLTLTLFMAMLDMTIVFLALPTIAAELQPGATQQLWVLHIGEIVGVGLVLSVGRLADRFGARRVLAIGVLTYGAASLLAASSVSIEMLIVARALLGAASVSFAPSGMILIRQLFPDGRRFATAIGVFMASASAGMALGPPIGGLLIDAFSWQAIFLVNVLIAVLVLPALALLPYVPPQEAGRLDPISVLLSMASVALFIHGVQELAAGGPRWYEAVFVLAGVFLGHRFVRRQRRLDDPLLDPALFGSRVFTLSALGIGLIIIAQVGAEMQMAQHLQTSMGLTPRDAGLLLIMPAGLAVLGTIVAPGLLRWFTPAQVMGGGALLSAAGAVLVAATAAGSGAAGISAVVAGMSVVEVGAAPMFGLGAGLIVASAPEGRVGSASAVQDISGGLGNSLGLTIGGTLAFVTYQATLSARLPLGLTRAQSEGATDSVGAAMGISERVDDPVGSALAVAARESFAGATQSLYVFAAALFLAIAVLVLRGLRHARLDDQRT